jgi:hypothetical protein
MDGLLALDPSLYVGDWMQIHSQHSAPGDVTHGNAGPWLGTGGEPKKLTQHLVCVTNRYPIPHDSSIHQLHLRAYQIPQPWYATSTDSSH